MAPNQKPIANNLKEIANTPGLGLTLDFGYGFHQELTVHRINLNKILSEIQIGNSVVENVECLVSEIG